ncbi:inorganic diphosphatase [Spirosoma gilvum]
MKLPKAFVDEKAGHVNVIIETPKGSRNKYTFDPETELFKLKGILPAGTAFPLDFGFIPGTKADDGDPVDVLVLTEQELVSGCWLECRLLGVLEAEQQDKEGKTERNDRLVAVPLVSHDYGPITTIDDMGEERLNDITHFFEYYNAMKGGKFKLKAYHGPDKAISLVKKQTT